MYQIKEETKSGQVRNLGTYGENEDFDRGEDWVIWKILAEDSESKVTMWHNGDIISTYNQLPRIAE